MDHSAPTNLLSRDLRHVWHPCSQMKDYETFLPLVVDSAKGSYIHLKNGKKIIDAISSWWCKSLGHGHPRIIEAIKQQMDKFEHVILANTTHELVVELSEELSRLLPSLNKVMYASDGACAIEIALKMALHAKKLQGQAHKTTFLALENSYHGDTCLALSVSDLGRFREAYEPILNKAYFLRGIPYVHSKQDALWSDCSAYWPELEKQLESFKDDLCAIIVEPLLQGSAGMLIYSQDFLRRIRQWAKENDIYFIADEVFTGIGRTGLPLACQHAAITPDFLCLGKSLTAGFLPLSAVVTSTEIYNLFYDDYEMGKTFIHSHTHSGNALALTSALTTLKIMEDEKIYPIIIELEKELYPQMQCVMNETNQLRNLRYIGSVVAADLIIPAHLQSRRVAHEIYQHAMHLGALLRPLGNTLYWAPPYTTSHDTLTELRDITIQAINHVYD